VFAYKVIESRPSRRNGERCTQRKSSGNDEDWLFVHDLFA
jgi:hypothetical protein